MENIKSTNNSHYFLGYKRVIFENILAIIKNVCTFAVLKDNGCTHFVGQAVNLLKYHLGYFYVQILRYWRLSIRKICICSRSGYHYLSAAYMAAAFLLPNLLNAERYE